MLPSVRELWRDLRSFDPRTLFILTWAPIALTLIEFQFVPFRARANYEWNREVLPGTRQDLMQIQLWWVAGVVLLQVVIPTLVLRGAGGMKLGELGLKLRGTLKEAPIYLGIYVLLLPLIFLLSRRADFRLVYPIFQPPGAPWSLDFAVFEVAYCLQFFAVEYFFRGVMVLGLKPALGRASILVMLAPYCLVHSHKLLPEALGSIVAGLVLGCLSWRTGTVIYGWCLHYAIALTLDLLALS
jgi:hypothetical protein